MIGFELNGANNELIKFTNNDGDVEDIVIAHITDFHKENSKVLAISTTKKDYRIKFAANPPFTAALVLLRAQF